MEKAIAETHFFPCLEYFYHLHRVDEFVYEGHESFQKQSYRSRCEIMSANGVLSLNIPIIHGETRNSIQTTLIDYKENWLQPFWRTIEAAYKRSPYFDYFELVFKPILFKKTENLFELNSEIIAACTKFLAINTNLTISSDYQAVYSDQLDLRNTISPKKKNTQLLFSSYPQNFGDTFSNNLSIIDLIMNEGPAGILVLKTAQKPV